MANEFKSVGAPVIIGGTVIYTCPDGGQAVIHALYLSNIDGDNPATVDIAIQVGTTTDGAVADDTYYHIGKTLVVPEDSTLELDKQVNLMAGDSIKITASENGRIEAVAAILEIT
jgi:hypothetical protein